MAQTSLYVPPIARPRNRLIQPDMDSSNDAVNLHPAIRSGIVITAEHVIRGCRSPMLGLRDATRIQASIIATDARRDLALLCRKTKISGPTLSISAAGKLAVGTQVAAWGFPRGYSGLPRF